MSDLQNDADDSFDPDDDGGPIYEERRRRLSPLARMLVILAIVIATIAFAGLVWFAYNQGVHSGAEEAAPVLRAEPEPIKRKPEDAGGMAIPHQDKLVYNRIAPGQSQQPVERLLPPPEAPVERPVAPVSETVATPPDAGEASPAGDSIAQAIVETTEDAKTAAEGEAATTTPFVRTPEPVTPAPTKVSPPPAPVVAAPPMPQPVPEKAAEKMAEPAPQQSAAATPPPAAATGPAWRIQLASLTSESAARKEWLRLQKANSNLLGKLELDLRTVNLAKGTFYRIQAGPLADRAAAGALCSQLKARKQDCLVVAP